MQELQRHVLRRGDTHPTSSSTATSEALHFRGKLQKAGYTQTAEKWDSDSDSDESDEGRGPHGLSSEAAMGVGAG